jgi:uncharacterized Zn finger protein
MQPLFLRHLAHQRLYSGLQGNPISFIIACMMTLRLTESDIRQMAVDQSFARGEQYFASGAVVELQQRGNTAVARVRGSQADGYRVTIELDEGRVVSTRCSCPYDWGGICKHIVATLLTLMRKPDIVEQSVPLDELLPSAARGGSRSASGRGSARPCWPGSIHSAMHRS